MVFGLTFSPFLSFKKSFCLHISPFSLDLVLSMPILDPNDVTPNQQTEAHSLKYKYIKIKILYTLVLEYKTHLYKNLIIPQHTKTLVLALHFMGRQGGNSMAASGGDGGASSIALLQERFRQLQKMREKRQEMELLKLFPGPETLSQTNRYEPSVASLMHPEMNLHGTTTATRPCFQDSLSLGLNLHTEKAQPQKPAKEPPFMDFWSKDSNEVDTSLRL